jgi:2-hydroxy-4-carboxymuconate semialdehyde hemiacetal dehydrogenase
MKLCVVGEGAFGNKHIEALNKIDNVDVSWLIGGVEPSTKSVAENHNIPNWSCNLDDALNCVDIDGVILATPTPLHAAQAKQVMLAGKHVLIEIPMADNLKDAVELVKIQKKTGVIAMAGHVRRFNPSHQWIHNKVQCDELNIQQMDVQTYFFRRTNINAKGEYRAWTDSLLWHHACHTVDLFQYQTGQDVRDFFALQGPIHSELNIPMDMSIGLKTNNGAICNFSLSFNNDGPLGTHFRYICDNGTYIAHYDELMDGFGNKIDLSGLALSNDGIELIDREFIDAIKTGKEPNASLVQCLSTMQTLDRLQNVLC